MALPAHPLTPAEARERLVDRQRRCGVDARIAERQADRAVGNVFDRHDHEAGKSAAERARRPRRET